MIGTRASRVEDERFLRGEGRFIADLHRPGMLEAFILRSPRSHARFSHIEAIRALAMPGVVAVLTSADIAGDIPTIPCRIPCHGDMTPFLQPVIAHGTARYCGEPLAVVVAERRVEAENAAEEIDIDWAELPVVARADVKTSTDSPIHSLGNVASHWRFDLGDVDAAMKEAAARVRERYSTQRHSGMPLETRGLLAEFNHATDSIEMHGPTKVPHTNRAILARMIGLSESQIRFIEPDVGGSFGVRGEFYPEDFLIPWAAMRLRRPIRWIEDRFEHFAAINHSREMNLEVAACADKDGLLTGFDVRLMSDMGAYIRTHGDVVPSHASAYFTGPYRIRNYRCDASAALSNKTPTGTMRAPGMFEANFARERAIDVLAGQLGLDALEIRRRNLIPPEQLPWRVGTTSVNRPVIYDSGDYRAVLEHAAREFDWETPLPATKAPLRRGRGMAALVEPSGFGLFEGARVEIDAQGAVTVVSGCSSQGQGHETSLAQVAAELLGVPLAQVKVRHGDTSLLAYGGGSYASRTAVMSGHAVYEAASAVRGKVLEIAAKKLEVAEFDLALGDGKVSVKGAPRMHLTLGEVAQMAAPGNLALLAPSSEHNIVDNEGLNATRYIRAVPSGTAAFAVHMAEVCVDTETGKLDVERYLVACDVGRALNPMIVEGQLVGGVAQGLGGTLLEALVYGPDGQFETGSFADYLLPSVDDVPPVKAIVMELAKSPTNPLGVKGVGEVGTSGVAAAVSNAVANALGKGARICALPLTPERVLQAMTPGAVQ
jgi:aerobic carbon-monoxide dehydrogenase large subunit